MNSSLLEGALCVLTMVELLLMGVLFAPPTHTRHALPRNGTLQGLKPRQATTHAPPSPVNPGASSAE